MLNGTRQVDLLPWIAPQGRSRPSNIDLFVVLPLYVTSYGEPPGCFLM